MADQEQMLSCTVWTPAQAGLGLPGGSLGQALDETVVVQSQSGYSLSLRGSRCKAAVERVLRLFESDVPLAVLFFPDRTIVGAASMGFGLMVELAVANRGAPEGGLAFEIPPCLALATLGSDLDWKATIDLSEMRIEARHGEKVRRGRIAPLPELAPFPTVDEDLGDSQLVNEASEIREALKTALPFIAMSKDPRLGNFWLVDGQTIGRSDASGCFIEWSSDNSLQLGVPRKTGKALLSSIAAMQLTPKLYSRQSGYIWGIDGAAFAGNCPTASAPARPVDVSLPASMELELSVEELFKTCLIFSAGVRLTPRHNLAVVISNLSADAATLKITMDHGAGCLCEYAHSARLATANGPVGDVNFVVEFSSFFRMIQSLRAAQFELTPIEVCRVRDGAISLRVRARNVTYVIAGRLTERSPNGRRHSTR